MSKKRSKLELYLELLSIIKEGTQYPTRIMYKANMSWVPTQQFLEFLVSKSLIEVTVLTSPRDKRTKKKYSITDRGEKLLAYLHNTQEETGFSFFELRAES